MPIPHSCETPVSAAGTVGVLVTVVYACVYLTGQFRAKAAKRFAQKARSVCAKKPRAAKQLTLVSRKQIFTSQAQRPYTQLDHAV